MNTLQEARRSAWTYADYLQLEDSPRYEVWNGELHSMAAPDLRHQRVVRNVSVALWNFVREADCGEVLWSPIDVVLDAKQTVVVQPDVVYVAAGKAGRLLRRRGVFGAPDLIIEVLSPATTERDCVQKKDLYEAAGVAEYWLLDPARGRGEVHCLEKSAAFGECSESSRSGRSARFAKFALKAFSDEAGDMGPLLKSRLLPGWTLDLALAFRQ